MELVASRIVAGGDALARAEDGRVALVEGALPDERVRVEITADRADMLRAKTIEVLDPSPARLVPPCVYARAGCGGCTWQHIDTTAQRTYKRDIIEDALRRIGRVDNAPIRDTIELPTTGFRTTVRALVVDGRAAFRRHHSHDPIEIDTCMVAHPLVDEVLQHGRFGRAREITVRASATTGERCIRTDPGGARVDVADDVRQGRGARIRERIAGRELEVSAAAFFQSRTDGADAIARVVTEAVGSDRVVADLYCGVGLFGALVDTPRSIVAVESNRDACRDARHNLAGLPARIVRADVNEWEPEPVDVVVADPTRAGLGRPGARTVLGCEPERIVLVSCDAAALARDIALLRDGGYSLRSITPIDLFPHTPHIECVSVLEI